MVTIMYALAALINAIFVAMPHIAYHACLPFHLIPIIHAKVLVLQGMLVSHQFVRCVHQTVLLAPSLPQHVQVAV